MSNFVDLAKKYLPGFIVYSLQTLVMACFVIFALRFFLANTGWINHLIVFLLLAVLWVLFPYVKSLRHNRSR